MHRHPPHATLASSPGAGIAPADRGVGCLAQGGGKQEWKGGKGVYGGVVDFAAR